MISSEKCSKILVSIVVTAYNAERYIERCLNSIISQSYPNIEIIVVDDCSTDATGSIITQRYPGTVYKRHKENMGPAAGRNKGLSLASGEFVSFLDADDYWNNKFIETTVRYLIEHTSAIAVSTGHLSHDWKGRRLSVPDLSPEDKEYFSNGKNCSNFYEFWAKYKCILTGTVLIRRKFALATNGQRIDLRLTQDLEFWGYLATFGEWGFIPDILFITDQQVLLPKERLNKFKKRFTNFRNISISSWGSRIIPRLDPNKEYQHFYKILAHIATIKAIACAYTFQFNESRKITIEWYDHLEKGIGSFLKFGLKIGKIFWPMICITVWLREFINSYLFYYLRKIKFNK